MTSIPGGGGAGDAGMDETMLPPLSSSSKSSTTASSLVNSTWLSSPANEVYEALRNQLALQVAVRDGAEGLLRNLSTLKQDHRVDHQLEGGQGQEVVNAGPDLKDENENEDADDELRTQVEAELVGARNKIQDLVQRIRVIEVQMYGRALTGDDHMEGPFAAAAASPMPASTMALGAQTRNGPAVSGVHSPHSFYSYSDDVHGNGPADASDEVNGEALPTEDDAFAVLFERVLEVLHSLQPSHNERSSVLDKLKYMDELVQIMAQHPRVKFELQLRDTLPDLIHLLAETQDKDVRAGTYRLLRHLIVDQDDIQPFRAVRLDLYLIRSLSRDHKADLEKEHAVRLIRALLTLPDIYAEDEPADDADQEGEAKLVRPVSVAVVRAIVSIAENQDEKSRLACLETLAELALRDMSLLIQADGLRVILQTLSDGPHDLAPALASCFTAIIDWPATRIWLRPGVDIEIVLAGLTQVNQKAIAAQERVVVSAKITTALLKSWSGIMYFNLNDKQAIRSIVESLTNPQPTIRTAILDMFFELFGGRAGPRHSGMRSSLHSKRANQQILSTALGNGEKSNLIDQYLAFLLMVFLDAGLVEALASIAALTQEKIAADKISLLISEILQLANRILPVQYAAHAQSLPRLFALTTSFDTSDARVAASSALVAVDTHNRDQSKLQPDSTVDATRNRSNSVEDSLRSGQRQIESTKMAMAMQIDDVSFRNLLLETQVLATKDHTKWQYDMILELLEGPLHNPKRLDESMRASKFMRRLLGFYHPFAYRYADLRNSRGNAKWTHLACTLLNTLLSNPDGIRYLHEDKLLRQIVDSLAQLDPLSATPPGEVMFSKQRLELTLTSGYFEMLGTLTKQAEGVKLLDQLRMFTACYRISELRSREDLIRVMLRSFDYSMDGHPRVLLSKALTSSYRNARVFATQHLGSMLTHDSANSTAAPEWQIRLLLTQIYDPSPEVCELAVRILETACMDLGTLQIVVQMRPTLDHLGNMGDGLLTRFLSTSVGVRYLHEIGFIERELEDWYNERNAVYVVQLELQLASALRVDRASNNDRCFDGTPPPHFYGELVKTDEGCDMLEDCGHFSEFAEFIRENMYEDQDADTVAQLKSVLWAVGHIGSTTGGLDFIDREYILESIVDIAEESPIYSLRGTAFFVLGLIASTVEGIEMLEEYNWQGVTTPVGRATGICVPMDLRDFVETEPWQTPAPLIPSSVFFPTPTNHLEVSLLAALANLSNHILATQASKTLARLKHRHMALFSDAQLWHRAWEMLGNYHYRSSVRRYILELFDLQLGPDMVPLLIEADQELREAGARTRGHPSSEQYQGRRASQPAAALGIDKSVKALMNGVEDVSSDDDMGDDGDDDEESTDDEGKAIMPVQVLQPVLSVKGFLL